MKTPSEYARRHEARQARFTARLVAHNAVVAGGVMSYDAPGSWANQACSLGMSGPVSDEDVDALVRFYEAFGVDASIEASLMAHPTLFSSTARSGFVVAQTEHLFSRTLRAEDATFPEPPDDMTIEHIARGDHHGAAAFARTLTQGYAPEGAVLEPALVAISERTVRDEAAACFLVRVGGDPAAACVAVLDGDEVHLSGASVLHGHRRRGIQTWMLGHRTAFAMARGVEHAIVISAPGVATERNAWRLGFRPSYGRVNLVRPRSS